MKKNALIVLSGLILGGIFGLLDVSSMIADQNVNPVIGYGSAGAVLTIRATAGMIQLPWVIAGAVLNGLIISFLASFATSGILTGEYSGQTVNATPMLMIILLPLPFLVAYAQTRRFDYAII